MAFRPRQHQAPAPYLRPAGQDSAGSARLVIPGESIRSRPDSRLLLPAGGRVRGPAAAPQARPFPPGELTRRSRTGHASASYRVRCGRGQCGPVLPGGMALWKGSGAASHAGLRLDARWCKSVVGRRRPQARDRGEGQQCGSPLGGVGVRRLSRRGQRLSEAGREQPVAPG
jgi:hypothetical protein